MKGSLFMAKTDASGFSTIPQKRSPVLTGKRSWDAIAIRPLADPFAGDDVLFKMVPRLHSVPLIILSIS